MKGDWKGRTSRGVFFFLFLVDLCTGRKGRVSKRTLPAAHSISVQSQPRQEGLRDVETYVLRDPPETLAVTLAHDDRAHEDLDRTNVGQGNLEALAGRLVQAERVAELVLRDSARGVNLVSENEEGDLAEDERTQHELSERFERKQRGIAAREGVCGGGGERLPWKAPRC